MRNHSTQYGLVICTLAVILLASPALAGDLEGKWNFAFVTEGGAMEMPIVIAVAGDKVDAKMGDTKLTGTIRGGELEISGEHYSPDAGFTANLKLKGKVEGNKITGSGEFDVHEFTFTATKATE